MTAAVGKPANTLAVFVFLQCVDVTTTLVFLSKGIAEGNPVIRWVLPFAHSPWIGLLAAKLAATLIGLYCYHSGRITALRIANAGYLLIVAWNLTTIATALAA